MRNNVCLLNALKFSKKEKNSLRMKIQYIGTKIKVKNALRIVCSIQYADVPLSSSFIIFCFYVISGPKSASFIDFTSLGQSN